MKFVVLISFLLGLSWLSFSQKKPSYLAKRDVIISESENGSVYITKDKNCKLYEQLCPAFDAAIIRSFCTGTDTMHLQQHTIAVSRYWTDLYLYKGNYYVYAPSDWMNNKPVYISDSILFDVSTDFTFYPILESTNVGNGQQFITINAGEIVKLTILPLKKIPGAAIWQIETEKSIFYKLKISSNAIKNFPMLVNDCLDEKCLHEFSFDEIDFSKLLKDNKN